MNKSDIYIFYNKNWEICLATIKTNKIIRKEDGLREKTVIFLKNGDAKKKYFGT